MSQTSMKFENDSVARIHHASPIIKQCEATLGSAQQDKVADQILDFIYPWESVLLQ